MPAQAITHSVDLLIRRGEDYPLEITLTNPDGTATSLAGDAFVMTVRKTPDSPTVLHAATGVIAANKVKFTVPRLVTLALPIQTLSYDIKRTRADTMTEFPFGGKIIVAQTVGQ